ncbi:MAG: acyl-CoA dehydrogenase family protein [Caulobacteraceae bacterium]
MATITAEDLTALTDSLHRLLQDKSTETDVRRTMETPQGYDPALWEQLAEMGVVGVAIDEEYGGVGAGPVALERVMEEAGACCCALPCSRACWRARWCRRWATTWPKAGCCPALLTARVGDRGPHRREGRLDGGWGRRERGRDGRRLDAGRTAAFVTHGQVADAILVVARTADAWASSRSSRAPPGS